MKLKNVINPFFIYKRRARIYPYINDMIESLKAHVHSWLNSYGIPVTSNERKVASLKNKHRGRRCFIIGSGPSLKIEDLDKLKNEITFACNKIYLAFDKTEWRPTYYSIYDVLVAENNVEIISGLRLHNIFGECIRPCLKDKGDITWIKELARPLLNGKEECRFSTNMLEGAYGGWTVIFLQMQLAFFMGIKEIYLIGVDFSFTIPTSTGKSCSSGEILEHQGEVNHFHPDYRKPGETWTMPLLNLQYKAFLAAKKVAEAHGVNIINVSRRTALDVFTCVDFDSILLKDYA